MYNGGMNFGYILCGSLTVVPWMDKRRLHCLKVVSIIYLDAIIVTLFYTYS